jgi:NADPH:quinone reductase-like Zn-dependent oxidoreductase
MAGEKMTETMQRWTMSALGRENLTLIQEPIPQPGPGEVRVRVNAVALNYRDKMVIEGTMPIPLSFPFTPASDMAGVVTALVKASRVSSPAPASSQPSFRSGSTVSRRRTRAICPIKRPADTSRECWPST